MILFYVVVQIFAGSYPYWMSTAVVEFVAHAHASQSCMTWREAIQRDVARLAVTFQCTTEKDASSW